MSNKPSNRDQSPKLLQGDPVPMPNYRYQSARGQSGSISANPGGEPIRRFQELGNFVLSN